MRRVDGDAAAPVDRARDAEADRLDFSVRDFARMGDGGHARVEQRRLIEADRLAHLAVVHCEVGTDGAGQQLGPAEVDPDDAAAGGARGSLTHPATIPGCHGRPPP